jgi:hypothetical protein
MDPGIAVELDDYLGILLHFRHDGRPDCTLMLGPSGVAEGKSLLLSHVGQPC